MLDLNITLWIQMINFFIALYFLNWLLIKPIRGIIAKRESLMDGLASEADQFHSEAMAKLKAYEDALALARKQAGITREESKNAGMEELQKIVGGAHESAKKLLDDNRALLQSQADLALSALRDGIDDFSTRIGNKLAAG